MNTNYNINLIKSDKGLYDLIFRKNKIIEMYHGDKDGYSSLDFYCYDPLTNVLTQLMSDKLILEAVHIHVCYRPCELLYVATLSADEEDVVCISTFDPETAEISELYSFKADDDIFREDTRLQIFVLSPQHLIIQQEVVDNAASGMLMGNIAFSQFLFNIETGIRTDIIEENMINNGINMIAPLNESDVMIKTGYSYLEDSRLGTASENDALIESVFITSTGKLISDIELKLANIDMQLISSTYNDRYILKPELADDYFFYNIVDIESGKSECVFYDHRNGNRITAKNSDVSREDLRLAYVIDNKPYVRKLIGANCEFINIETGENDISFYDEEFLDSSGRILITAKSYGKKNRMRLYKYPGNDLLLEESCNYITCLNSGDDYYIYISR